ncbi:ABC transporter permease [Ancylobacter sp. 6x-1]|uniref:ABC transporter permease n=1 Tax=Ancylobacter crimeensis TaxID=2579147 RepID=A0ABT0D6Y8_9HYPH|nr:ABC transporter permease [Ancylobacter crimeensis]MCK0195717.1 ABC transporter permease [Ancylobacter crimeensis]
MRIGGLPWLLLPMTVLMALFFGAFAVFAFVSFLQPASGMPGYQGPFGVANYVRFLTDPTALGILAETIVFAIAVTIVSILLGYPLAYIMARSPHRIIRSLLLGALVLTFLSGSINRAYGWLILLGRRGVVNDALLALGLVDRPVALVYNWTGVFIALLHFTLPYFALTVFGSIRSVPAQVEEAARDLGAGALTTFFRITVPITVPAIISGAALVFSLAISAFAFPLLLGGGRVRLISNFIYDQLFVSFNLPFAAASSTIFLIVAVATLCGFFWLEGIATRRRIPMGGLA